MPEAYDGVKYHGLLAAISALTYPMAGYAMAVGQYLSLGTQVQVLPR